MEAGSSPLMRTPYHPEYFQMNNLPPSPDPLPPVKTPGEGEMIVKMDAFGGKAAKSIHFYVFHPLLSRTWGEKGAGRMSGAC
jgi:hypothetical protein